MPTVSETPSPLPVYANRPSEVGGRWTVARVIPRHEKALTLRLSEAGLGYYLPMVETRRILAGKKRTSHVPIFSGYVFAALPDRESWYVLTGESGVYQTIEVVDQHRFVREMDELHTAMHSARRVMVCPEVQVDTVCRVRSGPLMGHEGPVISRSKPNVVTIVISTLQRAVMVEIDPARLEVVA